jgi:hypothetical protein
MRKSISRQMTRMFEAASKHMLAKRLVLGFLLIPVILIMVGSSTVSYGQATLSVKAKNISDNSDTASIDFGQLTPDTKLSAPGQYIEVNYESHESLWFIDIYTNNTNWNVKDGYQRGGLVTADGKQRVPLMWRIYDDVQPEGVAFSTTTEWAWLKDKGDLDDPNIAEYDESWAGSFNYVNICYGGPSDTNLSPYPNTNPPSGVRLASSPIYVYLGGLFGSAGAGEYSTVISFDLYHIAPEERPVISHIPIERIGIIGNKIVFNARITDNKSVDSATIHYKIGKSSNWQSGAMDLQGTPTDKMATYVLLPQAVSGPCDIFYWIEARDGEDNTGYWRDESSPQKTEVTQSVTEMVWFKGGSVVVPDGNPDDGEVMVDIPEGALSKDTKITIEQITDLSRIPGYSELGDWKPVAVYNFTEEGIRFKKPVTMNLLYFDLDGDGYPEDWNGEKREFNESQLACYWWDGITWRPVGGKVDRDKNIATVKVSHFSYYGLFKARPMGISEYRPKERIITPACADGKNDVAYFSGLTGQVATVRIYDITGRKIRTIEREPYEWDGTDEDGNIVESGVYIYQFKADINGSKRLVSGTIAVAK